jgi:cysteine desulfurase
MIVLSAVYTETGLKCDLEALAAVAERHGVPLIVDGVGIIGREKLVIPKGVKAVCFSGHKMHAPKGVGCCYINRKLLLEPLACGGPHEFKRRPGTENLPGIVALAKAFDLLNDELPAATERMGTLRDYCEQQLMSKLEGVVVNGSNGPRVCNTSSLSFSGVDGESLLMNLDLAGLAVSHGSACASGALEPSRILMNMGLEREVAESSIRISLSRLTTREEVERAVEIIIDVVRKMRKLFDPARV